MLKPLEWRLFGKLGPDVSSVAEFPARLGWRQCPGCGYRLTQLQVQLAKFGKCPRCEEYRLEEFQRIDLKGK